MQHRGFSRFHVYQRIIATAAWCVMAAATVIVDGRDAAAQATGTITGQVSGVSPRARRNVIVYIERVTGNFAPPQPVRLDQRDMQFIPRVLPILNGTTVNFSNSDSVSHNTFTNDIAAFDLGNWAPGESRTRRFNRDGLYRILCRMHPEMAAFILVLQNPYFAVTGADGSFQISNVPPGTHTLVTWGERMQRSSQPVTVAAGQAVRVSLALSMQ